MPGTVLAPSRRRTQRRIGAFAVGAAEATGVADHPRQQRRQRCRRHRARGDRDAVSPPQPGRTVGETVAAGRHGSARQPGEEVVLQRFCWLLEHGAEPEAVGYSQGRTGRTPLQLAREQGRDEIAGVLKAGGAKV